MLVEPLLILEVASFTFGLSIGALSVYLVTINHYVFKNH